MRISCPDATGLGCDIARLLLDFGLRIMDGESMTYSFSAQQPPDGPDLQRQPRSCLLAKGRLCCKDLLSAAWSSLIGNTGYPARKHSDDTFVHGPCVCQQPIAGGATSPNCCCIEWPQLGDKSD